MKKKPIQRTIPDVREAPARDVDRAGERGARGYPSARDLLGKAPEWKVWLEGALRVVMAPAAMAGAITLAASGCDTDLGDDLGVSMRPMGPTIATSPQGPLATRGGKIPNTSFTSGPGVVLTPIPTVPTTTPIAAPGLVRPVSGIIPTTHPIATAGEPPMVMPAVDPPGIEGDVATVLPVLPPAPPPVVPTTLPEAMGGGARPVIPHPTTAVRGRVSSVTPHPAPPAVPGGDG